MDDNKKDSSILPISSVLVVMTILGVVWFNSTSLKGTRPAINKTTVDLLSQAQNIPARLWQDPFDVVSKNKTSSADLTTVITGASTVVVLMTKGGAYSEDSESRMRRRYAAVSALIRLGYEPVDSENMGCFYVSVSGTGTSTIGIPFEVYRKEDQATDKVLLLWLNENAMGNKPLESLSKLVDKMGNIKKSQIKILGPATSTCLRYMLEEIHQKESDKYFLVQKTPKYLNKILGPITSTCLRYMLEKIYQEEIRPDIEGLSGVTIYSPFATADDQLLLKPYLPNSQLCIRGKEENISNYFYTLTGITFIRTIGTDKSLLKSIVEELKLRNVDPVTDEKCHIAVIGELDTFYSRSMKKGLTTIIEESKADVNQKVNRNIENQILVFSYLRGIDGQLPVETTSNSDNNQNLKKPKSDKDNSGNDEKDRPVGHSQYDYLLRLTKQIQCLNKELRDNGKGEIKAIGVLGSDDYDKLLVLQAIRPQFPAAIFFTTDLDAQLLCQSELKWTRNMVVASSFGLKLCEERQHDIPAFRDCHQTSLYFSMQLALGSKLETGTETEKVQSYLTPRIFEIGHNGAVDITLEQGINKLHPPSALSPTTHSYKIPLYFFLSLLTILGLSYVSSDRIKNPINKFISSCKKLCFVYLIPVGIISSLFLYHMVVKHSSIFSASIRFLSNTKDKVFKEEPFSLFDGISIWPTEILRLLVAFLAVCFIYVVWQTIESVNKKIEDRFHTCLQHEKPPIRRLAYWFSYFWVSKQYQSKTCIWYLWKEYLELARFRYCCYRTIMHTAVFFLLALLLHALGAEIENNDFVPGRGSYSFSINYWLLRLSVFAMLLITFFVVDRYRLYRRFIQLASGQTALWREKANDAMELETHPIRYEYQIIQLIAEYTEGIKYLNFYPFLCLFFMIISRNAYFDNWNMSIDLFLIFLMLGFYTFACTYILYQEAKKYKAEMLMTLQRQIVFPGGNQSNDEQEHTKNIIQVIESIQHGAFRPIFQQPLIQLALLPFGSAGGLVLIEYLSNR